MQNSVIGRKNTLKAKNQSTIRKRLVKTVIEAVRNFTANDVSGIFNNNDWDMTDINK